jgi:hypothetical protein
VYVNDLLKIFLPRLDAREADEDVVSTGTLPYSGVSERLYEWGFSAPRHFRLVSQQATSSPSFDPTETTAHGITIIDLSRKDDLSIPFG